MLVSQVIDETVKSSNLMAQAPEADKSNKTETSIALDKRVDFNMSALIGAIAGTLAAFFAVSCIYFIWGIFKAKRASAKVVPVSDHHSFLDFKAKSKGRYSADSALSSCSEHGIPSLMNPPGSGGSHESGEVSETPQAAKIIGDQVVPLADGEVGDVGAGIFGTVAGKVDIATLTNSTASASDAIPDKEMHPLQPQSEDGRFNPSAAERKPFNLRDAKQNLLKIQQQLEIVESSLWRKTGVLPELIVASNRSYRQRGLPSPIQTAFEQSTAAPQTQLASVSKL